MNTIGGSFKNKNNLKQDKNPMADAETRKTLELKN